MTKSIEEVTLLSEQDIFLFNEGSHFRLYEKLGSHLLSAGEGQGTYFAVWAPDAEQVCVIGDFNDWNKRAHPLKPRDRSGIWEGVIPEAVKGARYKYHIVSRYNDYRVDKADPFGIYNDTPPETVNIVWDLEYTWNDQAWMAKRGNHNSSDAPISIYEVHLGSWMRLAEHDNRWLTYRELAVKLTEYVQQMGYTHVQFLPVMEHPFYGSWGYQTRGYFAPTSRHGTPQAFMYLIDCLHQQDIGVILDWVPSHFPTDEHGIGYFDGTHLYEHSDPQIGFHPDWKSFIFNYGRSEVRSFLISSALFWLDTYHADGLRVDAVASMLYLDYSREEGEWLPNKDGGNEHLEAVDFIRKLNEIIHTYSATSYAEESTAWPGVSRPTDAGGLGFTYKWNMGWMNDTLSYIAEDPVHRKYHHNKMTFGLVYAFDENFVLPLSHDEVVHGKGSMLGKMPGDDWQRFANLRAYYGFMYAHPGKKLLFMGAEIAQEREWNHDASLDWHLLEQPRHKGVQTLVRDLNQVYRDTKALHELDFSGEGFEWVDWQDADSSILCWLRRAADGSFVVCICNFTPLVRSGYRVGVPQAGCYSELLNTDSEKYGGSGVGFREIHTQDVEAHGRQQSLQIDLPPLATVILKIK